VTRFDQIEHASLTDVGVRRSHNQDSHAVQLATDAAQWKQRGNLYIVADGMGAHAVGEKASEQAAGVVPHIYHKHAHQGPAVALRKAFVEANAHIHAVGQQNREFQGMGTTATALLLQPGGAWIGHVGDSRAYRIRDGVIEQLTYDHSLVWEYARLKNIDPDQVTDIPSNVIHRCLGPEPLVQVDLEGPHPLRVGDIFLLCSDGLSGLVTDPEIGAVAAILPPTEACRFLVDLANLRGGPDNITVMIVRVGVAPEANGSGPVALGDKIKQWPRLWWSRLPWPVSTLLAGMLLVAVAIDLHLYGLPGAWLTFLLATAAVLTGVAGLAWQYHVEQLRLARAEEAAATFVEPRIHRRAVWTVDATMVEKWERLLEGLRQRAGERHWSVELAESDVFRRNAEEALVREDWTTAFRELCRSFLPLTRALQRHRHKEEVFQPVWDKRR
jgi:protein phosphatase